ncbi:MAG: glycosyltransferase, partial [Candidatus Brocadiia bacterium]
DASLAKTVLPPSGAVHVCYCHSPPRYLWNMYHQYLRDACRGALGRVAFRAFSHRLRIADYCAAGRVDHFLCNSRTVRRRISRYYGRPARVVHPPPNLDRFPLATERGDYYLVVSQLNAYKRVDLAVRTFNGLDRRLVVVGDGPERRRLERLAGPNVELRGFVPDEELPSWYAGCRAFVFPGEEDFGITPLEAQASGKAVIAYGAGGATETVVEGETGLFFREPSAAALAEAVERYEQQEGQFEPEQIRSHAELFSPERFKEECRRFILRAMEEGESR